MLTYQDVFVPGGFPRYTYNPRSELGLEVRLQECKQNLCKLATVTGHTKLGKSVLAKNVLPLEDAIWIEAGGVAQEEDFWQFIVEGLHLFQGTEEHTSAEKSKVRGGRGTAGAQILGVSVSAEVSASNEGRRGTTVARSRSVSSRVAALSGLKNSQIPIVIDDFHYLPFELQGKIVRALKPLIFDGLPVVVIAIPHRRYDAIKVEREMTGRIVPIDIPVWTEAELTFIPSTGFNLLNHPLRDEDCSRLAAQAIGSPHLMQDFCRGISRARNIVHAPAQTPLNLSREELDAILRDVAEAIGRPIFEKLARGPRQRTDRIARTLKDGRTVDIYQLVLQALAYLRPGLDSLEYEELRSAIRDVAAEHIPNVQEVARVLKHMATIAAGDQSSTPVIDFDEETKQLHITDPFFAFYLRWGRLES
jgi:hypothetical protein